MNVLTDDLADDLLQERSEAFKEEQAHLSLTVEKLKKMERELEEKIDSIAAQAAAEKREIRENLALNFDGDTESMETYIEFEVMNHTIDRYNITRDAAQEELTGRIVELFRRATAEAYMKGLLDSAEVKDADGKTIDNSRGLQRMEAIYNVSGLTDEQRRYLFECFDVGKAVIDYNKAKVEEELKKMRGK